MAGGWCSSALSVGQFVIFLPFHPSVLKPDFDLPFGETKSVGNLNPSPPGQIPVKMKLLFKLQNLLPGVSCSGSLGLRSCVVRVHWEKENRKEVTKCGQCSQMPYNKRSLSTRGNQTLRKFTRNKIIKLNLSIFDTLLAPLQPVNMRFQELSGAYLAAYFLGYKNL